MLDFLKKMFRFKRVDLEAKLRPTSDCTFGGVGEVEWEAWSDGTAAMEISIKHSSIPNGSDLQVTSGGADLTTLPVVGGFAKQRLTFDENQRMPAISSGAEADFRLDGVVLYRGAFRRD